MSAVSTHSRSLLPTPVACTAQASRNSSPATNTFSPYWLLRISASFCGTLVPRRGPEACGDPRAREGGGRGHSAIPDGAARGEPEDAEGEEDAPGPPGIFQSGPQAAAPAPHFVPGSCPFPTSSGHQPGSPVPSDPALLQYSRPSIRSQSLASLPELLMPAQVPAARYPCHFASSPAAPLPCLCHPHPTPAPSPPTPPRLPGNAGLQQVPPVGSAAGGEGWDTRGHKESWEPDQRVAEGVVAPGLCPRPLDFWVGPQGPSMYGSFSSVCSSP